MGRTSIEWTDASWNPVRGCTKVSEGCRNCWAMRMAGRFSKPGMWGHGFAEMVGAEPRWTGRVELIQDMLEVPLRWRAARRIFLSSFDLFHESLPDAAIDRVLAVMALSPRHTYQVLTKRPERMRPYVSALTVERLEAAAGEHGEEAPCHVANWINGWSRPLHLPDDGNPLNGTVRRWPLPNVWLGVSVEDQATADARIPLLLNTPAAVRFVSYEPALGPVDFTDIGSRSPVPGVNALTGRWAVPRQDGSTQEPRLHQVIVGGESGPGARPCDVEWIRSTRDQCRVASVACFVKQVGAEPRETGGDHLYDWPEYDVAENCATRAGVSPAGGQWWAIPLRDRKGGDMEEWPEDLRIRQFPEVPR